MLKFAYFFVTFALLVSVCFAFEGHAYAYVDPGSGLFLLQGISSVFAGLLFHFRKRLKSLMRRPKVAESELHQTDRG
jgi:hypothetical protein